MTEAEVEKLNQRLLEYMRENGMRSTWQRSLVSSVFFKTDRHLSIDELHERVRKEDSSIGYATVYRTLKLLEEAGLAQVQHFGDGLSRYEIAHLDEHHDHMICLDCNAIVEFESEEIERIQERVARKLGFRIERHTHELYVSCKKNQCPNRNS